MSSLTETRIHASCVALGGRALLIMGPSGAGKSDLTLRLIDRGARLVSDDYTVLTVSGGRLHASPPPTIAGLLEIRHIGIIQMAYETNVPVALIIGLGDRPERMPERPASMNVMGIALPRVALAGLEPSAPIKAEYALACFGLPGEAA